MIRARRAGIAAACLLLSACGPPQFLQSEQRAARAYQSDRMPVALRRYARLVKKVQGNPLFWARLGNCEALLNDTGAAARAYTRALSLRPDLVMVRYNLARVRLEEAYLTLSGLGKLPGREARLGARARTLRQAVRTLLVGRRHPEGDGRTGAPGSSPRADTALSRKTSP